MKKFYILLATIGLLTACGTKSVSSEREGVTKHLTVKAYQAYDNSGIHIETTTEPRERYKVSAPLMAGETYKVSIEVPWERGGAGNGIKEVKLISYSRL